MAEEWEDEEAEEPEERDWDTVKKGAAGAAFLTLLVVGWLIAARPTDERPSMAGFSVGAGGPVAPAGKALFERRKDTGLDNVYIGTMGEAPSAAALSGGAKIASPQAAEAPQDAPVAGSSSSGVAHAAEPARVSGGGTGIPGGAAAPAGAEPDPAKADEKELAAAGVPTTPGGLTNLGGQPGLLSSLAAKMLDHPKVLRAVFDNKLVVDAFMSRDVSRRNCSSGSELKNYLSDPGSAGIRGVFPVLQQALSKPAAAEALAGTEMASRLMDCPSVKQLSSDSAGLSQIAAANPKALSVLTDSRTMAALATNSRATSLLAGATAALGGGR